MMNVQGKSDLPIVPAKSPNNAAQSAAEAMEGRGGTKGKAVRSGTRQTQGWESVSLALDCIRDPQGVRFRVKTQGRSPVR